METRIATKSYQYQDGGATEIKLVKKRLKEIACRKLYAQSYEIWSPDMDLG